MPLTSKELAELPACLARMKVLLGKVVLGAESNLPNHDVGAAKVEEGVLFPRRVRLDVDDVSVMRRQSVMVRTKDSANLLQYPASNGHDGDVVAEKADVRR